jgi:hypothetical protein
MKPAGLVVPRDTARRGTLVHARALGGRQGVPLGTRRRGRAPRDVHRKNHVRPASVARPRHHRGCDRRRRAIVILAVPDRAIAPLASAPVPSSVVARGSSPSRRGAYGPELLIGAGAWERARLTGVLHPLAVPRRRGRRDASGHFARIEGKGGASRGTPPAPRRSHPLRGAGLQSPQGRRAYQRRRSCRTI